MLILFVILYILGMVATTHALDDQFGESTKMLRITMAIIFWPIYYIIFVAIFLYLIVETIINE